MIENKFDVFLNKDLKETSLKKKEKPNYFSQLFSKSLWFPKLREFPLEGASVDQVAKVEEKASEVALEKSTVVESIKTQALKTDSPRSPSPSESPTPSAPTLANSIKEKINLTPKSLTAETGFSSQQNNLSQDREYLLNSDFNSFLSTISSQWDESQITGMESFDQRVDVLFLGLDEFERSDLPEVVPMSLIESEQDLLGKMIKAMNLGSGKFIRYPLLKDEMDIEFVLAGIMKFNPRVVVPLGATATNLILQRRVKLSNVHGDLVKKGYNINGTEIMVNISPLFHPQLLEINQSMKRTAWLDMKSVMTFLEAE